MASIEQYLHNFLAFFIFYFMLNHDRVIIKQCLCIKSVKRLYASTTLRGNLSFFYNFCFLSLRPTITRLFVKDSYLSTCSSSWVLVALPVSGLFNLMLFFSGSLSAVYISLSCVTHFFQWKARVLQGSAIKIDPLGQWNRTRAFVSPNGPISAKNLGLEKISCLNIKEDKQINSIRHLT